MAQSRRDIREPTRVPLTPGELAKLRAQLAAMKEHELKAFYRGAYQRCELHECRFPTPRSIQELVQAWKQLRKWR
jgi:hypothetical protein